MILRILIRKELLSIVRDKRLIVAMLLPLLLFPLFTFLCGHVFASLEPYINNTQLSYESPNVTKLISVAVFSMLSTNSIGIAADMISGEKERGTLERILVTRSSRTSIFLAKLSVLCLYSLVYAVVILISYVLSMLVLLSYPSFIIYTQQDARIAVDFNTVVNTTLIVVSFLLLINSLYLFISIFFPTVKSARTALSIVSMLMSLIGIALLSVDLNSFSNYLLIVPVLNSYISMSIILYGKDAIYNVLYQTIACNAIITTIVIASAKKTLAIEKYLK